MVIRLEGNKGVSWGYMGVGSFVGEGMLGNGFFYFVIYLEVFKDRKLELLKVDYLEFVWDWGKIV